MYLSCRQVKNKGLLFSNLLESTGAMLGIRMIAFLTLAVLVPSCSCTELAKNCSCRCLLRSDMQGDIYEDICDWIKKLQTSDDSNQNQIKHLTDGTKDLSYRFSNISDESTKAAALEGTVDDLKRNLTEVWNRFRELQENTSNRFARRDGERTELREEVRALLKEAKEESDRQRDSLAETLKELARQSSEDQQRLSRKQRDLENKILNLEEEIAAKNEEERRRTSEVKKELLKRLGEVEMQCMDSKTEVLDLLSETEVRLREADRLNLGQIQETMDAVAELSRNVQKATAAYNTQSEKLEARMKKIKNTVSSLRTSQSELKDEIRTNLSLSVQHLKAYVEDHFTELEQMGGNLTSKISQLKENLVRLERELSNYADLARTVKASGLVHQSLRSELREQCADRHDVTRINSTLAEVANHLEEVKKKVFTAKCKDILPIGTCQTSVAKQMCRYEYTATNCCASCEKAMLPPGGST